MTVAPEPVIAPALHGGRRLRRHWEHALVALGICLPVPLLAVTGLSIPLPATVERLAAALVPWADAETLDESEDVAASGAIVYAPGEIGTKAAAPPSAAANPHQESPADAPSREPGGSADGPPSNDGGGGNGGSGGSGGSTSTTPTGGTDPTEPTSPVQGVVDDVGEATQPVVDEVEGTVTDVVGETQDTVDGVVDGLGK